MEGIPGTICAGLENRSNACHLSFGLSFGSLIVYIKKNSIFKQANTNYALKKYTLAYAFSILFNSLILYWASSHLFLLIISILISFTLSGIVLALLLTRFKKITGKVYGADLLGAAVGTLLIVVLLETVSMIGALFFVFLLASVSSYLFGLHDNTKKNNSFTAISSCHVDAV